MHPFRSNAQNFRLAYSIPLTILLLLITIASVGAQTPPPASQSGSVPGDAGGSVGATKPNAGGQQGNNNQSPNAGGQQANSNQSPAVTPPDVEFKINDNSARGPAWFVLIIAVGVFILAVMALRSVRKVGATLEKKAMSLTTVIVIVAIVALGIYFVGRTFGSSESNTIVVPHSLAASVTPEPTPTPVPPKVDQAKAGQAQVAGATNAAKTAAQVAETPKPTPVPTPFRLSVSEVQIPDSPESVAGLGDDIVVKVKNLKEEVDRQEKLTDLKDEDRIVPRKLVLFLGDVEMKKLYPFAVSADFTELRFKLTRTPDSRDAWTNFLAQPKTWVTPVTASVGREGKQPIEGGKAFVFRRYYPMLLNVAVILFVVFLVGFLIAARKTPIMRDSGPAAPVGGPLMRPYSLARLQAAWWFFIILGAFLFIALVTWDYDTLTTSALALLGIGSATALGAAVVDSNKRESTNTDLRTLKPQEAKLAASVEELKTKVSETEASIARGDAVDAATLARLNTDLAAKEAELEQVKVQVNDAAAGLEKPVSAGFFNDVLSDVNGVTLHRFQMLIWTIVLGLIFVWEVWSKLMMPDFSETLLALMGLSAATYIGFKIPEKQTNPDDVENNDDSATGEVEGGNGNRGAEEAAARAAEQLAAARAAEQEAAARAVAEEAARVAAAQEEEDAKKENVAEGDKGVG